MSGVRLAHRAGTIGLVYTTGTVGRVIRGAQEDHWNHVVIAKGDGTCFSAEPRSGVRLRDEDEWDDVCWLVHEPFSDAEGQARADYCQTQLGVGYNYPAILAFSRWWIPTPGWFIRWANDRPETICSELAVRADRAGKAAVRGQFMPIPEKPWFDLERPACTVAPAAINVEFRRKGW